VCPSDEAAGAPLHIGISADCGAFPSPGLGVCLVWLSFRGVQLKVTNATTPRTAGVSLTKIDKLLTCCLAPTLRIMNLRTPHPQERSILPDSQAAWRWGRRLPSSHQPSTSVQREKRSRVCKLLHTGS